MVTTHIPLPDRDYSCAATFCDDPACNTHGPKNDDDGLRYWEVEDPAFDEHCPVGDPDGSKGDPAPNMHCTCWWDGDGCCRCKAPPMTDEQKREQGMED